MEEFINKENSQETDNFSPKTENSSPTLNKKKNSLPTFLSVFVLLFATTCIGTLIYLYVSGQIGVKEYVKQSEEKEVLTENENESEITENETKESEETTNQVDTTDWKTYTNEDLKVSFKYPESFQKRDDSEEDSVTFTNSNYKASITFTYNSDGAESSNFETMDETEDRKVSIENKEYTAKGYIFANGSPIDFDHLETSDFNLVSTNYYLIKINDNTIVELEFTVESLQDGLTGEVTIISENSTTEEDIVNLWEITESIEIVEKDETTSAVDTTDWKDVTFSQDYFSSEMPDTRIIASLQIPQNWNIETTNFRENQGLGGADCQDYIIRNKEKNAVINISPYCNSSYTNSETITKTKDEITLISVYENVGDDNHDSYIVSFKDGSLTKIGEIALDRKDSFTEQELFNIYEVISIPVTSNNLRTQFDDISLDTNITIEDSTSDETFIKTWNTIIGSIYISNIEEIK